MICVLIANGFEEVEALTSVDVLRRAELEVKTVSITEDKLVTGAHGITVSCDELAKNIDVNEIEALVLPGGMPGATNLDASEYTDAFIDAVKENDGVIGAICAAPFILGKRGLLKGKKAICYPGFEEELVGATLSENGVAADGRIVTAKSMEYSLEFANKLVSLIKSKERQDSAEFLDSLKAAILSEKEPEHKGIGALKFSCEPIEDGELEEFEELDDLEEFDESEELCLTESPDYSDYTLPDLSILAEPTELEVDKEEISAVASSILQTFENFKVKIDIKNVTVGPRITRFELVPAPNVRVTSIVKLFDDICLNLAAEGIRMEAPIPGKSAIGIEIPNKRPALVRIRELLENEEFKSNPSKTTICIGKDVEGNPIYNDITKLPHLIVAGATGMGKSVCINSMIASLLAKARPDEVKFLLIDPKTVEFAMYNGMPHLLVPVLTDVKAAVGALAWVIEEMNRRYELLAKHEVRKLDSYNELVKKNSELGKPLPKIIIVIDELNDLMQQARKPIEAFILNITQKARAAGIHMIIGTQRPSLDVITGVIKANVPSRIAFKVTSYTDSRTVLDQAGAEKLLNSGDMLYHPVGFAKPIRVQGAFISDAEIERLSCAIKKWKPDEEEAKRILSEMAALSKKLLKNNVKEDDEEDEEEEEEGIDAYLSDRTFLKALDVAFSAGKISTSLLQRKLGIGYSKAAKYIDAMESFGVVSEPNGQRPRDVLITAEDWKEFLARRSLDD